MKFTIMSAIRRQFHHPFTPAAAALALIAALSLQGCVSPDAFGGSRREVSEWAHSRGFQPSVRRVAGFELFALQRAADGKLLSVYLEGDGAAWPTPFSPPRDPTPIKPIALAMAAANDAGPVAYLGRPCQYLDAADLDRCSVDYWTERRFAPEVVAAYNEAIDQLKADAGARDIRLVGYSGGGVLAVLIAARRSDVDAIVTVASPLALRAWERRHGATQLTGSLDPVDEKAPLDGGVHFVGEADDTVPSSIVDGFVRKRGGRMVVVPGFDHECCWSRAWPALQGMAKEARP